MTPLEPELYQRFFEEPGGHVILDSDCTIVDAGEEYRRLTLTRGQPIMGKNFFDILPHNPQWKGSLASKNAMSRSFDSVKYTLKPDKMSTLRYDVQRPDGAFEERWWEITNIPIVVGNELVGIIHRLFDVTTVVMLTRGIRHQRWSNYILYVLVLAVVGVMVWRLTVTTQDIQNERRAVLTQTCNDQNGRNKATKKEVSRLFTDVQGRELTDLLVDAVIPIRNCTKTVKQAVH